MCASSAVLWLGLSVHKSRLFRLLQVSFSLSPFFIFLTLYLFMASFAALRLSLRLASLPGFPVWSLFPASLSGFLSWSPPFQASLSGFLSWSCDVPAIHQCLVGTAVACLTETPAMSYSA